MELVHIVAGGLAALSVFRDAVPYLILDDHHADLFQMAAEILDVIADHAVFQIYGRLMVEHVEGAGDIDFEGSRQIAGFLFLLLQHDLIQIPESRHIFRSQVIEIFLVDQMHTAVDDRSLRGLQAIPATGDQLKEGQHKLILHRQRIAVVVAYVQIERIDIARLAVVADAGRRNLHNLPVQMRDKGRVFTLWVTDDDVVLRAGEKHVQNLSFGREGLAAAGDAEDQAVGVLEHLPIHHDHVVGQGVDPVIQSTARRLKQLLGRKGDKDCRAAGGKTALDIHEVIPQRKRAHQALFLLEVQPHHRAVMPLRDGAELQRLVLQILPVSREGYDQRRHEEHVLIVLLQAAQKRLGVLTVGGQVRRDNVHVIAGTHSLFLFLDLGTIEIGDFPLDGLDRLISIYGMDMQRHENVALHIQKIRENAVIQLCGVDLQEVSLPKGVAHAEAVAGFELEAAGRDKIFDREAGRDKPLPVEAEGLGSPNMEDAVQQTEPRLSGQGRCRHAELFEVAENSIFDAFQLGLSILMAFGVKAKGEILGLDDAVVAEGKLCFEHSIIFVTHSVKVIAGVLNKDPGLQAVSRHAPIEKAQREIYGAVEVIEESGPAAEDGVFVVRLAQLIVDVLKLDGFGVMLICGPTNAVRPHLQKRDAVLRGLLTAICAVCSCDGFPDRLFVCASQRAFGQ